MPEEVKTAVKEITEDALKAMLIEISATALKEIVPALKEELKSELKKDAVIVTDEKSQEEKDGNVKSFISAIINKDHSKLVEMKAVASTSGSFGYTIPTELASKILEKKDKIAKMRKLAFAFNLAGPFQLPTEGTGVTTYWVGENTSITASDPTVGKKDLSDYYLATRVLMPRQLLNTSAFNVIEYIANLCSRALRNTEESAFVAGDGSSKPSGLRGTSGVGSVAQASTSFAYDDIVNLFYTIKEQYREGCVFMTSVAGIKLLRKLKDNNGLPIFDVRDQTVFNKPVFESEDIPSNLGTGTNETEIWCFDPSYYWIKDGENMFMDTDKIISTMQTEIVVAEAIDGIYTLPEAAAKLTAVK